MHTIYHVSTRIKVTTLPFTNEDWAVVYSKFRCVHLQDTNHHWSTTQLQHTSHRRSTIQLQLPEYNSAAGYTPSSECNSAPGYTLSPEYNSAPGYTPSTYNSVSAWPNSYSMGSQVTPPPFPPTLQSCKQMSSTPPTHTPSPVGAGLNMGVTGVPSSTCVDLTVSGPSQNTAPPPSLPYHRSPEQFESVWKICTKAIEQACGRHRRELEQRGH